MDGRTTRTGLIVRAGFIAALACVGASGARAGDPSIFSDGADDVVAAAVPTPPPSPAAPAAVAPKTPAPSADPLLDPDAKVPFARDAYDPLAMDTLFADDDGAAIDLTVIDREDWRPEHAVTGAAASPASPKETSPKETSRTDTSRTDTRRAEKSVDPEPDAAITPPAASASHDPLDRPQATPAAAPPAATAGAPAPATGAATQPAEQPLPPQEAAIKAALDRRAAAPLKGPGITEKRKERDAIAFFYAAHGFAPAWSEKGQPIAAVAPVLARLALADEDALKIAAPKSLKTDGTADEVAEIDIALTEAVVAYARQATGARIEPRAISPLIGAKPDLADPAEILDALIAAGPTAGDALHAQNPGDSRYVALRDQLAELRGRRGAKQASIPAGPTLRVGMSDPRVPALRSRFGLDAADAADRLVYDAELSDAVADFQRDHDLSPTGTLNKKTQAALSPGAARPAGSEAAIVANMEMWRWMPRDLGADRIEVNVPDFLVTVFHDNQPVAENRVVVGKTETPTPLFSNTMKYLIVNPVWNVPQSIIKKELLPKGGGSLSYLSGRGYKVSYRNGEIAVQQLAGGKNALGRIKFIFPNDYSVYLHDTPSKALFSASTRAFSHGCVRVDKPFDFAESVLNDGIPEGGRILWTQERLDKLLGDKERYVNLPKPLPIHIEYFTASVDPESGRLKTRPDIYGYAHAVAVALGVASEPAAAVAERKPRRVVERPQKAAVADVDSDPR